MGPITYLRNHEGQDRFLDFAVITPNWGSEFGLNELNAIDLPFPEKFSSLIERPALSRTDAVEPVRDPRRHHRLDRPGERTRHALQGLRRRVGQVSACSRRAPSSSRP